MIDIRRDAVAGQYGGTANNARLLLRVDVGAEGSLDVISGDLFLDEGGNFVFHHSFQSTTLVVEEPEDGVQLVRGPVKVHREDILDIARIDLRIPDEGELLATYTFYRLTAFGRQTALTLVLPLQKTSQFFRQVDLEIDQVRGVPLPEPFNPSAHPDTPSDVPARLLSAATAYRDAGIDLRVTLGGEDVEVGAAGDDALWTDEELHAAMVDNFEGHEDTPQWRLYLLLATRYVRPGVLGIMFDSGDDFPRQGAAVFADHPAIADADPIDRDREYLFTIVHELGHAFNFLHSFQKGIFETHGVLPRPDALSWNNYPQLYPFGYAFPENWDGSHDFWTQFRFSFDRHEIAHLRHDDALEVIMGGRSFGFAGHLEERPFELPSKERDISVTLWVPPAIEFMEQVEGDVRVRNESDSAIEIAPDLDPASKLLEILIRRPGERYPKVYQHFKYACAPSEKHSLLPGEAVYQELGMSFGHRRWFVDEPGTYEMQAVYCSPDGRRIHSDVRRMRVLLPDDKSDRLAADFFTVDTGLYFGLEGSRIERFRSAADVLEEVRAQTPMSSVAQQVARVNALRDTRVLKRVSKGKVIEGDRKVAADHLIEAFGATLQDKRIKPTSTQSNLRVSRALMCAAQCYAKAGYQDEARAVVGTSQRFLKAIKAPKEALGSLNAVEQGLLKVTA